MKMKPLMLFACAGIATVGLGGATAPQDECRNWSAKDWNTLLTALQQVETGGQPNNGIGCVGDGGKAIGCVQLHECAFVDAQEYDASLKNREYQECLNDNKLSWQVATAYLKRYGKDTSSPRILARRFNGGPKGDRKQATVAYGDKFMKIYEHLD